ncbi:hypothetical protein A2757_00175 [Candidatus Giovannonibacteria bacterium RIFCSPHIGHO2_01_FULL_48_47]|nr:MAG: hypothetical protein A2757_00175 [Candidatus Giovannonibacteria bacterium RIFCSPHIGHO2_01_FULL_48_47]OGF68907.1 MAG: hypothetical protein A3D61_03170 [Candidatus Giovannonibacteria bacterium RIFCSPHIGHO2_02_FULL_48_15]OGF88537.1 MAG: hypothetical protein A3B26_00100 [Candidatus Giovannonibacteria bacterium RIFCSPLOWO2_01_FULL_48_47]OGF95491.1 MAG: hypothetical protein A2433_01680 [Candidatus Giovannonibacteria bacterium RIFOXYC1_FULL_48_8]OGF96422.1 MAG: hypothetical protein A2613_02590
MGSEGGFMKPSFEQGILFDRNVVELKAKLDHDEMQRLIEGFNLVYGIAKGKVKRTASVLLNLVVSGVSITAAPAAKTDDCFKVGDGVFAYRDQDFDRWLPATVPAVGAGNASTFEFEIDLNFQEIVEAHLGTKGSIDELKKALIENGKCWSPKQIDKLIRNCENGDNPLKLRTDGYANFFFIDIGGGVFAVSAYRFSDGWDMYVYEFADTNRWRVEDRVSFRN